MCGAYKLYLEPIDFGAARITFNVGGIIVFTGVRLSEQPKLDTKEPEITSYETYGNKRTFICA
jgi:hypothetical protein